jgi:thioredoxin-dependent peroxiredoxin
MLAVGAEAPDFSGTTADGSPFSLHSTRGRPLVLYFYPKANSSGCSLEARGFSQHYPEFQQKGVAVVGVSVDSVESERKFVASCKIPFPIVADADKAISRQYGVLGRLGSARRVTFFVDPEGNVAHVVEGLIPGPHVQAAVDRFGIAPKT